MCFAGFEHAEGGGTGDHSVGHDRTYYGGNRLQGSPDEGRERRRKVGQYRPVRVIWRDKSVDGDGATPTPRFSISID